eukprot:TRINITY_DN10828_c0_g1_i5.p2 TRINITY_DN10828_c0_g1~~TRINITY_DN10828_c0_g1_i5.p2  ORF type:complete len:134 (+),score=11.39 TRINITY_DN10828_c0_g1_i5:647-1048(+)
MGNLLRKYNQFQQSIVSYCKALEIHSALPNKMLFMHQIVLVLANIASTYVIIGDRKQALVHYQDSLTLCEKVNGPNSIHCANILHSIGKIYKHLKMFTDACTILRKAEKIYKTNGGSLDTLANIQTELSDLQQ